MQHVLHGCTAFWSIEAEKVASLPLVWWVYPCINTERQCTTEALTDWHLSLTFTVNVILLEYVSNCVVNVSEWHLVKFCLLTEKKRKNWKQVFSLKNEWSLCVSHFFPMQINVTVTEVSEQPLRCVQMGFSNLMQITWLKSTFYKYVDPVYAGYCNVHFQ